MRRTSMSESVNRVAFQARELFIVRSSNDIAARVGGAFALVPATILLLVVGVVGMPAVTGMSQVAAGTECRRDDHRPNRAPNAEPTVPRHG